MPIGKLIYLLIILTLYLTSLASEHVVLSLIWTPIFWALATLATCCSLLFVLPSVSSPSLSVSDLLSTFCFSLVSRVSSLKATNKGILQAQHLKNQTHYLP